MVGLAEPLGELIQLPETKSVFSCRTNPGADGVQEIVAWLVPAGSNPTARRRPLGFLEGKARYQVRKGFKMTEAEFLKG